MIEPLKAHYCYKCKRKLTENGYCIDCEFHPNTYCVDEINRRADGFWGRKHWTEAEYTKYYIAKDIIHHNYICDNCKYFMYHPLTWCVCCGQPMYMVKMKMSEFIEKYKDYKEGY